GGASASDFAIRVGSGWDVDQRFIDTSALVQFADTGTLTFGDSSSLTGVAVLTLQDTATNAANHILTVDNDTALSFQGNTGIDNPDITTGTNEDLTIIPNGSGSVKI